MLGQQPAQATNSDDGRMQELSRRVKQLASSAHDLSRQLHPTKVEQLGLAAALRSLCKELGNGHGLAIDFTQREPPPGRASDDAALCLYRIVQEALRNVVKHGGTRYAAVELWGTDEAIRLRITDAGAGFDPALPRDHGGLGLVSMRERLHLVGGEMAIDSRPSQGTRIDVRVPLSNSGRADACLQADPEFEKGDMGVPVVENTP